MVNPTHRSKVARTAQKKASHFDVRPCVSRVLKFGKFSNPKKIVVLFHGCRGDAPSSAEGWADEFATDLGTTLLVVPQARSYHFNNVNFPNEDPGYDWFRQYGTTLSLGREEHKKYLQRKVHGRVKQVNFWLKKLIRKYKLTSKDVILAGISQGTLLAALCGAHLNTAGVVLMGGVGTEPLFYADRNDYKGHEAWCNWQELLPDSPSHPCYDKQSGTKFLAMNGDKDHMVRKNRLEQMLAPFACRYHWVPGLEHCFPKKYCGIAFRWIQKTFALKK